MDGNIPFAKLCYGAGLGLGKRHYTQSGRSCIQWLYL